MARGGYQKRRIEEKKAAAKRARKRAERRKRFMTIFASLIVVGLIGSVAVVAITGGDEGDLSASPSPTPSPSVPPETAQFASPCTKIADVEDGQQKFPNPPCKIIDPNKSYTATIETTKGTMEVELFAADAPVTVNNFVFLARAGYYDGSIFHRVIPNFGNPAFPDTNMVQGGDPVKDDGTGGPGYEFGDENLIPFDQPGYLAMANAGAGTNGSQFFFLDGQLQHLNNPDGGLGWHTVFGQISDGLDVIKDVAGVPLEGSVPKKDVRVTKVTITEG